ncbi:MAG: hypothetical protein CFE47_04900 [Pseudomonas sp. PGPPP1]|nr:MAG: hypothetical protein CFE47_04900 [Pseudomonas sp. PGPPP1]
MPGDHVDDHWLQTRLLRRLKCGSWLACDAGTSVYQADRGEAIAGKPAPTLQAFVGPFPICHTNGGSAALITQSPTMRAL